MLILLRSRRPWQSLWSLQTIVIFGRFFHLLRRKLRLLLLCLLLWELWRLLGLLLFQLQLHKWLQWPRPGVGSSSCPPYFWHRWRPGRIREVEIENICWAKLFHERRSRVELTVEQVEGKGGEALYIIHIATNHHAFTLKRSRTVRRMKDFKFLQSAMEGMHPYSNLPGR